MERAKPKHKANLKVALGLGGACLLAFVVFQTFAIKKLMKTTECIQTRQAIEVYGIDSTPDGDDENSRQIRADMERCGIVIPAADE